MQYDCKLANVIPAVWILYDYIACEVDEFECDNGTQCISMSHRCNSYANCRDKTDQMDCGIYF